MAIFISLCLPRETKSQFANGADIGWLSQMESVGNIFYNDSGIQKNCMEILKEKGINALRFRVWVNPSRGWCGKKDVAIMAHRADSMGFKVMLDFHYSDTWADPGKQGKPAAWVGHSVAQLLTDVYNHTYNVLDTLKTIGVIPAWVQLGNETNDGMLWEDGRASTHMNNFAAMIGSGYNAVKAVDSTIQVIVHLSNGHNDSMYRWMFDGLKNNGAKWDIIGMSVYPYWANLPWATDNILALATMQDMISRYQTKVMVCETGYPYNQAVTANQFLLDLIAKTKSVDGLGVFYWEPECYNWQNYQLGAWDPISKRPTVALDAFLGRTATSVRQEKDIHFYNLDIFPNPFNPTTSIRYTLARSSAVKLSIHNILGQTISSLLDERQDAGEHTVTWNSQSKSIPSGVYFVRLSAGGVNLIQKIMLVK